MSETPSQTLETRLNQMTREAVRLAAETTAAQQAERTAMFRYAAGAAEMYDIRQAQVATREALETEQAHMVALTALEAEVERRELEARRAALEHRLTDAARRISDLEGPVLRRVEASERELRAAWTAWQDAQLEIRQTRALGQSSAYSLATLDGLMKGDVLPTQEQREVIEQFLSRWRLSDNDALFAEVPAPMAVENGEDHERRWRPVLAKLALLE